MKAIKANSKKDILDIAYDPTVETTVTIKGLDFKKAVGIWLCDKPAQKDLKEQLLGK